MDILPNQFISFAFFMPGGDDRRVLIWNMEKALCGICVPDVMEAEHNSNIFCLAINKSATKVFSGGRFTAR